MQPFSRETITDRRQPYVRWTAVAAGALVALGSWLLLQLIFTGGALTAIDPDEIDHLRGYSIGASLGSVLAPLIAMFLGGLTAGRLAAYYDRRVSGFHGALTWTIASVLGLALLGSAVSSTVSRDAIEAHANTAAPAPGTNELVDRALADINAAEKARSAPKVAKGDLLDAARYAATGRDTFDRNAFVERLDAKTSLSRPEAEAVLADLGAQSGDVLGASYDLALHRERALAMARDAGKGLFAAGIGLLLCLVSAVGGSLIGANMLRHRGIFGDGGRRRRADDESRDIDESSSVAAFDDASEHHASYRPHRRPGSFFARAKESLRDTFGHRWSDIDAEQQHSSAYDTSVDANRGRADVDTPATGAIRGNFRTPANEVPDRRSAVFTTARYPVVK